MAQDAPTAEPPITSLGSVRTSLIWQTTSFAPLVATQVTLHVTVTREGLGQDSPPLKRITGTRWMMRFGILFVLHFIHLLTQFLWLQYMSLMAELGEGPPPSANSTEKSPAPSYGGPSRGGGYGGRGMFGGPRPPRALTGPRGGIVIVNSCIECTYAVA